MSIPQDDFRRNRVVGGLLMAAFFTIGTAAQAHASDQQQTAAPTDSVKQQVRQLIREAGQMMERGDRRGAAARLEQARALWNEPSIDYNLGIVYGELQQPQDAAQALERFVRTADRALVLTERLEDAKKRLAEYERTLGRLSVSVSMPSGSADPSLFVDGTMRSKLPGGATPPPGYLFAPSGAHEVRVASSGLRDYAVSVELKAGELRKLDGMLLPSGVADSALLNYSTPAAGPESAPFYKKWWFWTAVGGGVAVIAGVAGAAAAGSFNRTAPGSDLDPIDVSR